MRLIDQMGYEVTLTARPQRIISLVPSQTELLFDLGLDDEVVGITRFCVHPEEKCAGKTIVGGTKQFNFDVIANLAPDLILGNKEENYEDGIRQLRRKHPVWMSDILTLKDAYIMIRAVGAIVGRLKEAEAMVTAIEEGFARLPKLRPVRAAYLIWRKPYMVAGHKTFANEMLNLFGFINVFGHLPRYPEVNARQVRESKPDVLLLSSEPFPFSERYLPEFREVFPAIPALLVDGTFFTWYGSRLLKVPEYIWHLRRRMSELHVLPVLPSLPPLANDDGKPT